MADLAASEAEADDGAAGVLDRGELGGELGSRLFQECRGGVCGDREDEGVEEGFADCGWFGLRIGEVELPTAGLL